MQKFLIILVFFFFNDTATTEIYTLSLHDALPILCGPSSGSTKARFHSRTRTTSSAVSSVRRCSSTFPDRKSTRLNSSHLVISYAVFCLKKKKKRQTLISRVQSIVLVIHWRTYCAF